MMFPPINESPWFTADQASAVGIKVVDGEEQWPYGPNIDVDMRRRLVAWARHYDLVYCQPRKKCLHWVVGQARRCGALREYTHNGMMLTQVMDHVTFWQTRDKSVRLAIAQPYATEDQALKEIEEIEAHWSVRAAVSPQPQWYRAADIGIEITPVW